MVYSSTFEYICLIFIINVGIYIPYILYGIQKTALITTKNITSRASTVAVR